MEVIKEQGKKKGSFIVVDEHELQAHVSEVVRQSVEDTTAVIRLPAARLYSRQFHNKIALIFIK